MEVQRDWWQEIESETGRSREISQGSCAHIEIWTSILSRRNDRSDRWEISASASWIHWISSEVINKFVGVMWKLSLKCGVYTHCLCFCAPFTKHKPLKLVVHTSKNDLHRKDTKRSRMCPTVWVFTVRKKYINSKFVFFFCPMSVFVFRVIFGTNRIHYPACSINSAVF